MYPYSSPPNGSSHVAPQMPWFNPMAVGMPPVASTQTSPIAPAWGQPPVQQQAATTPVPQPSPLEQSVNDWLKQQNIDLNQFDGNIGTLLDGLYEGAKRSIELEDQLQAAQQQPSSPSAPANEPIDLRRWQNSVQTGDDGRIVPKPGISVPWEVVQRFNEVQDQIQQFRYDPQAFLKQNVASLVEEKAREIADQRLAEFQAQQALDNSFEAFIGRNASWMYENGDRNGKLTDAGRKYVETVKAAEDAGVRAEHVLDYAWQTFQGNVLKDALEAKRQEFEQARQQAESGIGQDGLYRPQQDVQPQNGYPVNQNGQPRTPDGRFAPAQPPQPVAPQYSPAAFQNGRMPQLYSPPGTPPGSPQHTGYVPAPAAGHQQSSLDAQQPTMANTPQRSFMQEHGLGAAMEPLTRSDSHAHSVGGDDEFPDVEDVAREVAARHGIDMTN